MRIQLLIGTRKGGFIATSDEARREWSLKGPLLKGSEVNHIAHVGDGRLVLAGKSGWWGPAVQISDDAGETWREPGPIRFEEGRGHSVERIWFVKADPRVRRPALCGRRSRRAVRQRRSRRDLARGASAHRSPDAREVVPGRRRPDGPLDGVRSHRGPRA